MSIPELIFIIPYRDREKEKEEFITNMTKRLDGINYKFIFAHQQDNRAFNRGAFKNLGFLYAKSLYPNNYENITFVFNDVDIYPKEHHIIDYFTKEGTVKHFYGFDFALGGIFSITGKDFLNTKGFPNYWGWGFEDNKFNERCLEKKLIIDRSNFYSVQINGNASKNSPFNETLHGRVRNIYDRTTIVYMKENSDDIDALNSIKYNYSNNMLNITHFLCQEKYDPRLVKKSNVNGKLTANKNFFRRSWKLF